MKFAVTHTTTYIYAGTVRESFNEARLQPFDGDGQDLLSFQLVVSEQSAVRSYKDFYGNRVHSIEIASPHEVLEIRSEAMVETTDRNRALVEAANAATGWRVSEIKQVPGIESQYDFVVPSQYTPASGLLWRFAMDCLEGNSELWSFLQNLNTRVYQHFEYAPGETEVSTQADEAFEKKRGVCQDYAHVFIAAARSLRLPVRYVSGYLYVESNDAGNVETQSALESHAWVDAFIPEVGWVGLDPTHDRFVTEHYIVIARGRDYADARPLSGTYRGASLDKMTVEVAIEKE